MSEILVNKLSSLTGTNSDITIDPDGTGDTIIASGNLGIGTTAPTATLDVNGTAKSDIVQIDAGSAPTWDTNTRLWTESGFGARYDGYQHRFDVGVSRTQAMSINASGRVSVNQTSDWANSMLSAFATGSPALSARTNQTNGTCLIARHDGGGTAYNAQFYNNASLVGSIQTTASATSYVTSSDYRLKENVTDITGATDRLKQLNPVRFNFIADADTTVDGFIAHEVATVIPEAISGEKDEVDADGNAVMQGIDQSKLVPLLVATIQEQQTAIEALTARVTALEAE